MLSVRMIGWPAQNQADPSAAPARTETESEATPKIEIGLVIKTILGNLRGLLGQDRLEKSTWRRACRRMCRGNVRSSLKGRMLLRNCSIWKRLLLCKCRVVLFCCRFCLARISSSSHELLIVRRQIISGISEQHPLWPWKPLVSLSCLPFLLHNSTP